MIIRKLGEWPTLKWRSPFEELERMRRQMDRFLGSHAADLPGATFFLLVLEPFLPWEAVSKQCSLQFSTGSAMMS